MLKDKNIELYIGDDLYEFSKVIYKDDNRNILGVLNFSQKIRLTHCESITVGLCKTIATLVKACLITS